MTVDVPTSMLRRAAARDETTPKPMPRRRTKSDAGESSPRGVLPLRDAHLPPDPAQELNAASISSTSGRAAQRSGDGHYHPDTHSGSAIATNSVVNGGGEATSKTATSTALSSLPQIIALWRQRQDLRRAETRLDLQCQAVCRRACNGDKAEAAKLWAAVKRGADNNTELALILAPYRLAMSALDEPATRLEKQLEKLATAHPLWGSWAKDVRGLGPLSFAGLAAEARIGLGEYRGPAALWKRFGLAVIEGERQRRKAGKEEALAHAFSPQRRAFMYVIATNLIRVQRQSDPYRVLYDAVKEKALARDFTKAHAHNHAMRLMTKELLKHAFRAARQLDGEVTQ